MLIFSIDKNIPFLAKILSEFGTVFEFSGSELTQQNLIDTKSDVLITRSTVKVNERLLRNTNVAYVGTATSGVDHVDIDYLKRANIAFFDAQGSNSTSVMEYVLYATFLWKKTTNIHKDKINIGVVGHGHIGKKVADAFNKIGFNTYINDPLQEEIGNKSAEQYHTLGEIIETCNIITFHVPMTKKGKYRTLDLLNEEAIHSLKKNTLVINTSRGGVVNEAALLARKEDLFYALDVWANEPNFNSQLSETALLSTPHIAGHSYDGKINGSIMIAEHISKLLNLPLNYQNILNAIKPKKRISIKCMKNDTYMLTKLEEARHFVTDFAVMTSISLHDDIEKQLFFARYRNSYPKNIQLFS